MRKTAKSHDHRLRRYGIKPEEFDVLLAEQGHRCAICKTDEWGTRGPHVDHDHKTGRVRGLLCHYCNAGLGSFRDDPNRMIAAIVYLEREVLAVTQKDFHMEAIRLRKQLAMGKDIDASNFGVEPLAAQSRGKHADAKGSTHKRVLKPAARSAPPPVNVGGKYPAQANPDHGPHDGY